MNNQSAGVLGEWKELTGPEPFCDTENRLLRRIFRRSQKRKTLEEPPRNESLQNVLSGDLQDP